MSIIPFPFALIQVILIHPDSYVGLDFSVQVNLDWRKIRVF